MDSPWIAIAMQTTLPTAQVTLLRVWLVATIPVLLITLTRIFFNSGQEMGDVWSTISPAILPGLATVCGAFGFSQLASNEGKVVDQRFFATAKWVTYFYLGAFLLMFIFYPALGVGDPDHPIIEKLRTYVVVLHALDASVVATCLAAFFTAKKPV